MRKSILDLKLLLATAVIGCFGFAASAQITNLPKIDGDTTDAVWATAKIFNIRSVIDNSTITSASDFSGNIKVLWSADSIYLPFMCTTMFCTVDRQMLMKMITLLSIWI